MFLSDGSRPHVSSKLAAVRAATAKYHNLSAALADGYQLGYRGVVTGCISHPTAGAMGYHYFNWAKMDDPAIVDLNYKMFIGQARELLQKKDFRGAKGAAKDAKRAAGRDAKKKEESEKLLEQIEAEELKAKTSK